MRRRLFALKTPFFDEVSRQMAERARELFKRHAYFLVRYPFRYLLDVRRTIGVPHPDPRSDHIGGTYFILRALDSRQYAVTPKLTPARRVCNFQGDLGRQFRDAVAALKCNWARAGFYHSTRPYRNGIKFRHSDGLKKMSLLVNHYDRICVH